MMHDMDQTEGTPTMPTNVIAAIARVEAEVGGIEKRKGVNEGGGGGLKYKFRGIDAIAQAAQPLLGQYGVVMVPEVETYSVDDITINSKPWTDTTITVLWTIYGPGGVEDKITSRTIGKGYDNSDKGINKAMTGAFKNLLLRILCIGDPQDDTDGQTNERDAAAPPPEFSVRALSVYALLPTLSEPGKAKVKAKAVELGKKLTTVDMDADEAWLLTVEALVMEDQIVSSADTQAVSEDSGGPVTVGPAMNHGAPDGTDHSSISNGVAIEDEHGMVDPYSPGEIAAVKAQQMRDAAAQDEMGAAHAEHQIELTERREDGE
jgi:hypothetical protein